MNSRIGAYVSPRRLAPCSVNGRDNSNDGANSTAGGPVGSESRGVSTKRVGAATGLARFAKAHNMVLDVPQARLRKNVAFKLNNQN